jgi:hypothetical protein
LEQKETKKTKGEFLFVSFVCFCGDFFTDGRDDGEFSIREIREIRGSVLLVAGGRAVPCAPFRGNAQPAMEFSRKEAQEAQNQNCSFVPFEHFRGNAQPAIRNPQSSFGSTESRPTPARLQSRITNKFLFSV